MSIDQSILTKLRSLTEVSTTCEGRAFWLRPTKQDVFPYVVFWRDAGGPIDMDSCGPGDPFRVLINIVALAATQAEAIAISANIEAHSPDGLNGATWTEEGFVVSLCRLTDFLEDDYWDTPFALYSRGAQYEIFYQPA